MDIVAELHTIDFILLGLVVLSGGLGMIRGLTLEIMSIGCWLGAGVSSRIFFNPFRKFMKDWIHNESLLNGLTLVILFLLSFLLLVILKRGLSRMVRVSVMGGFDRALGGVFGIIRGWMVLTLIYALFLSNNHGKRPSFMEKSSFEKGLAWGARAVNFSSHDIINTYEENINEWDEDDLG